MWRLKTPLSTVFALCLIMGCMFFLPSKVINLRWQESIWPVVAIIMLLSFVYIDRIEVGIGLLLFYLIFATAIRFTPSSWMVLQTAGLYAAFYLVIVLLQLDQHKETIYNTLCCFAVLNVLWVLLQKYGVNVFFYPKGGGVLETGFFANQNELSVFLAIVAPCFLRKYWYWGLIVVGFGLIFAVSYIGILATGIVLLIYAVVKVNTTRMGIRNLIATIVCVLVGLGAYCRWVDQPGYTARIAAWKEAGELIKKKPLFGWGIGQTKYIFPLFTQTCADKKIVLKLHNKVLDQDGLKKVFLGKKSNSESIRDSGMWMELHNEYLQLWLEVGVVGLMLVLGVFAAHLKSFVQSVNRDMVPALCVTAACITAFGFFTWQIGRFTLLTVMMLAFIQSDYLRKRRI